MELTWAEAGLAKPATTSKAAASHSFERMPILPQGSGAGEVSVTAECESGQWISTYGKSASMGDQEKNVPAGDFWPESCHASAHAWTQSAAPTFASRIV